MGRHWQPLAGVAAAAFVAAAGFGYVLRLHEPAQVAERMARTEVLPRLGWLTEVRAALAAKRREWLEAERPDRVATLAGTHTLQDTWSRRWVQLAARRPPDTFLPGGAGRPALSTAALWSEVESSVARTNRPWQTQLAFRVEAPAAAGLYRDAAWQALEQAEEVIDRWMAAESAALRALGASAQAAQGRTRTGVMIALGPLVLLPLFLGWWMGRLPGSGPRSAPAPAPVEPAPPAPANASAEGTPFLEPEFGRPAEESPGADLAALMTGATSATPADGPDLAQGPTAAHLEDLAREAGWMLWVLERPAHATADEAAGRPVIRWSTSNGHLLGLDPAAAAALIGRTPAEAVPSAGEVLEAAFRSLEPGQARRSEADLGTREQPRWCEVVTVQPADTASSRTLVGVIRPVDRQREVMAEAEAARGKIKALEEKLADTVQAKNQVADKRRDLTKLMPAVAFEFEIKQDKATVVVTDAPSALAELHGLKPEELFDQSALLVQLAIKSDRARLQATLATAAENLKPFEERYGIMTRAGVERWFHLKGIPRRTNEGWTRVTAALVDETDRRKAADDLAAARSRVAWLEALGDHLPTPVFVVRAAPPWGFVWANRAGADHFGYSVPELVQVQLGNVDGAFEAALAGVERSPGAPFELSTVHECAAGAFAVRVEYQPAGPDEGGAPSCLVGWIRERRPA